MKIFGREPALIIGTVGSLITLLVAIKIPGLSSGQGAALTAALTAGIIAATTRPVAPALFTAVVAPVAALFAEYGMNVADSVVVGITSVILALFALSGIRPQVSPKESGNPEPAAAATRQYR
jgi:hypothetical protein